jgi:hypothetical protein
MQTNYLKEVIIMKRTFAIIAVLAAALAVPSIASAATSSSNPTTELSVGSAIQVGTSTGSIAGAAPSGNSAVGISYVTNTTVRSNDTWKLELATTDLTQSGSNSVSLSDPSDPTRVSNYDAVETAYVNNIKAAAFGFQDSDLTATGGINWSNDAGRYEGSATFTATSGI